MRIAPRLRRGGERRASQGGPSWRARLEVEAHADRVLHRITVVALPLVDHSKAVFLVERTRRLVAATDLEEDGAARDALGHLREFAEQSAGDAAAALTRLGREVEQ